MRSGKMCFTESWGASLAEFDDLWFGAWRAGQITEALPDTSQEQNSIFLVLKRRKCEGLFSLLAFRVGFLPA